MSDNVLPLIRRGHRQRKMVAITMTSPKTSMVVVVLSVWCLSSGIAALGLIVAQSHFGPDPAVLSLVMLAPALGAVPAWLVLRRDPRPWSPVRVESRRAVWMLAVVIVVCVSYFVAIAVVTGTAPRIPAAVSGVPVVGFIVLQTLGALCEEIGFRGILFHGLLHWMPKWAATLVVGTLFGAWHVQYFSLPLAEHAAFMLAAVLLTGTMTYTMVGTFWWRMVTCTLIHVFANLALAFSSAGDASMTTFAIAAATGAVVVAVLSAVTRKRHTLATVEHDHGGEHHA